MRLARRLPRALALDALNAASTVLAHVVVGAAFLADRAVTRFANLTDSEEPS